MKKFFATLLAFSITTALAGCSKPADEQIIDDITEDASVMTEATETVSETEIISETEETMSETTFKTVSETENNDESQFTQQKGLIGSWYIEDTIILIFEENRYIGFGGALAEIVNDTVKDGKLEFTNDIWFDPDSLITAEVNGETLYLKTEIDGEIFSEELKPYTQPAVSLSDFDGEWLVEDNDKCWGWLNLENGKGTFTHDGKDKAEADAEISLNGDKVAFNIGDYKEEYTYYTLEHPNAFVKFIFLLNDDTAFYMAYWY